MRKVAKPRNRITRWKFEQMVGSNFETWKGYSKEVQERVDCFCKDLRTGKTFSGKTWAQLAQRMGL